MRRRVAAGGSWAVLTVGTLSLAFESLVALLLVVMIFFAIKLNRGLAQMRDRETEMRALIQEFDSAAARARESAANLKSVGTAAEQSLRDLVERGQAIRDEMAFMIDRGDELGAKLERLLSAKGSGSPAVRPSTRPGADENDDLALPERASAVERTASRAERELERALRLSKGGR